MGFLRQDAHFTALCFFGDAKGFRNRRAGNVSIQHAHLIAAAGHHHRQHRGNRRLADASLSAADRHNLTDGAVGIELRMHVPLIAILLTVGAMMVTGFTHRLQILSYRRIRRC